MVAGTGRFDRWMYPHATYPWIFVDDVDRINHGPVKQLSLITILTILLIDYVYSGSPFFPPSRPSKSEYISMDKAAGYS